MKKSDFIVIAVVLALAGILFGYFYFANGNGGNYVEVRVDGEVIETLPLDTDFEKQYDFDGDTNTLVIKDGKAEVVEANCDDKVCVNHMPISRSGDPIACLPHKFIVTVVEKDNSDSEIDAVA